MGDGFNAPLAYVDFVRMSKEAKKLIRKATYVFTAGCVITLIFVVLVFIPGTEALPLWILPVFAIGFMILTRRYWGLAKKMYLQYLEKRGG